VTLQLSESVIESIRALVEKGEAPSASAFVEEAIRDKLGERRRARLYEAYEEASRDPAYMRDMKSDTQAFEATLADGVSSNE
jgi:Arc/MetJ-type ribon-helix-helix transcriptional regulator